MNNKRTIVLILSVLFVITVIFPKSAQAYIDPGTGSYFTQVVLGFLLGGLFAIKLYWGKATNTLKNLFAKKDDQESKSSKKNS